MQGVLNHPVARFRQSGIRSHSVQIGNAIVINTGSNKQTNNQINSGLVLATLGLSVSFWFTLEHSGPGSTPLGLFGRPLVHSEPFLATSCPFWSALGHSDPPWATRVPLWTTPGYYVALWGILGHSGPFWATLRTFSPLLM